MPFVVALLCWFVLSVPVALLLGRVIAVHGSCSDLPSTSARTRSTDRVLVKN